MRVGMPGRSANGKAWGSCWGGLFPEPTPLSKRLLGDTIGVENSFSLGVGRMGAGLCLTQRVDLAWGLNP